MGEALNVVAANDTVSVAPGIYHGGMSLPAVPVSVASQEGPEVTILDGTNEVHSIVHLIHVKQQYFCFGFAGQGEPQPYSGSECDADVCVA